MNYSQNEYMDRTFRHEHRIQGEAGIEVNDNNNKKIAEEISKFPYINKYETTT